MGALSCYETDAGRIRDVLMETEDQEDFKTGLISLATIVYTMQTTQPQESKERAENVTQQLKVAIEFLNKASRALFDADFENAKYADLVMAIDNFVATATV